MNSNGINLRDSDIEMTIENNIIIYGNLLFGIIN